MGLNQAKPRLASMQGWKSPDKLAFASHQTALLLAGIGIYCIYTAHKSFYTYAQEESSVLVLILGENKESRQ